MEHVAKEAAAVDAALVVDITNLLVSGDCGRDVQSLRTANNMTMRYSFFQTSGARAAFGAVELPGRRLLYPAAVWLSRPDFCASFLVKLLLLAEMISAPH